MRFSTGMKCIDVEAQGYWSFSFSFPCDLVPGIRHGSACMVKARYSWNCWRKCRPGHIGLTSSNLFQNVVERTWTAGENHTRQWHKTSGLTKEYDDLTLQEQKDQLNLDHWFPSLHHSFRIKRNVVSTHNGYISCRLHLATEDLSFPFSFPV